MRGEPGRPVMVCPPLTTDNAFCMEEITDIIKDMQKGYTRKSAKYARDY